MYATATNLNLGGVLGAGTEHDEHVVESLKVDVVPQQPPDIAHRPLELLFVLGGHGPGARVLLHVLQTDCSNSSQILKHFQLLITFYQRYKNGTFRHLT